MRFRGNKENKHWFVGIEFTSLMFVKQIVDLIKKLSNRATSVYLVDRTIPMLPEILSNDLCQPNEDKLVLVLYLKWKNAKF